MEEKKWNGKYYLGLDIGTDSVGWAVTDNEYNILKFHGRDAWGSVVFDSANLNDERRSHRSARRRLDRRQQRVRFVQELFAPEIAKTDERFFVRLNESAMWRGDAKDEHIFFDDDDYTDKEYYEQYPTIHHLICNLINNKDKHDARLVYLACAWLVAHRGHFLSNIDEDNLGNMTDLKPAYEAFEEYFKEERTCDIPWGRPDLSEFGAVLQAKTKVSVKKNELAKVLLGGRKPEKKSREDFPFGQDALIRLLAGGSCKVRDIFDGDEYADLGSISLGADEERFAELAGELGEDYGIFPVLRALYDWALLAETLDGHTTISEAKAGVYEQHKKDLQTLKYFIRKYRPEKYNEVFRDASNKEGYTAYAYHADEDIQFKGKASPEKFCTYIKKIVGNIEAEDCDVTLSLAGGKEEVSKESDLYEDMISRLEAPYTFMPKQKNTDNRVIPCQLYLYELKKIIENAKAYLPFLNKTDEDGLSVADKVVSVFTYKLPYFVGPLNERSDRAWIVRKQGRILPWNYKTMIDFDASEQAFISNLVGKCTYLPWEPVLPKDSLCYQKFMVLNEINNITVNGQRIPVEAKQGIYHKFEEKGKGIKRKDVIDFLVANGYLEKGQEESVSGIDVRINATLSTHYAFRRMLSDGRLTQDDVERIVMRASCAEDKSRLKKWLDNEYERLSEDDRRYICKVRIKDFGRISKAFLAGTEGMRISGETTGEVTTILREMWETNYNLMEILSKDNYTFRNVIDEEVTEYYAEHPMTLEKRLDAMYVSNTVRRSICRTLDVVKDVRKAFGEPKRIFIEMARGGRPGQKNKRSTGRREQILNLYDKCDEDVRDLKKQIEDMGEYVDNKLQSDKLFLYFMQFGRCAYSAEPIDLNRLMTGGQKSYDIEHIWPQAYVKDDSIINNKVLVKSELNGRKQDTYPIDAGIRHKMHSIWEGWRKNGNISEEKYKRLTRSTPFTDDERIGFINRQLTETSQSTKAVKDILTGKFPDAEIVCVKAGLVYDFRHEFDIPKSRLFNELHHAVDAYLNIVTGNVYHMKFTRKWFSPEKRYSVKTQTIFTHEQKFGNEIIWDGANSLGKVKKIANNRNTARFTKYAYIRGGEFFNQMPLKKGSGLVPRKEGFPVEKYGGYNGAKAAFFLPVQYKAGRKNVLYIMPVEAMCADQVRNDFGNAGEYAKRRIEQITGKPVENVTFPLGMRVLKINSMLSLDGFRVCIASYYGGGTMTVQSMMPFIDDRHWKGYVKKLERFAEKTAQNNNYKYDAAFDAVYKEENIQLYDLYIGKLQDTIYSKRPGSPLQTLKDGRDTFDNLNIYDQAKALLNIHQIFGRQSGGCDLKLIGGTGSGNKTNINCAAPNWKKYYSQVRIIDSSVTGLWERQSDNLLDMA